MADLHWLLCGFVLVACIDIAVSFKDGAPAYSCKDPTTFHTKKMNATHEGIILPRKMATSPYTLVVHSQKRTFSPGDEIKVTLKTENHALPFKGFFIHTVEGNMKLYSLKRVPYGTFENTTGSEKPSPCEPTEKIPAGGITHTDNDTKTSITVIWKAPEQFSKKNIAFVATAVKNYNTYWTNVRSHVLKAKGYKKPKKSRQRGWSASALWYMWQNFLRHYANQKRQNGNQGQKHDTKTQRGVNQGQHHENQGHHGNQGQHHGNQGQKHDTKTQHGVNQGQHRENRGHHGNQGKHHGNQGQRHGNQG